MAARHVPFHTGIDLRSVDAREHPLDTNPRIPPRRDISYLAYKQPETIPPRFWGRTFALRYFGVAMLFATLWGVSVLLTDEVLLILPLTLATSFAGTASFINAPRLS
jgi:hypothetical protein